MPAVQSSSVIISVSDHRVCTAMNVVEAQEHHLGRVGRIKCEPSATNSGSVVLRQLCLYAVLRAIGSGRRCVFGESFGRGLFGWRLKVLCVMWFGRLKDGSREEEGILYVA